MPIRYLILDDRITRINAGRPRSEYVFKALVGPEDRVLINVARSPPAALDVSERDYCRPRDDVDLAGGVGPENRVRGLGEGVVAVEMG